MRKPLIFLICLCCSGALPMMAQQKWSLKACIDYAVLHNIDVQKMHLEMQSKEIDLQTKRMSRLPDLNAGVGLGFGFGRSADREGITKDQSSSNTSFNLSSSMPIFTGFRTPNEVKSIRLQLSALLEDLDQAKENLSLQVTGYYLQVLYARELCVIAHDQVALSESQLKETIHLVEAGKKPESDRYEAQAELAQLEQRLVSSQNELQQALLELIQLINLPVHIDDFALEDVPESWQSPKQMLPLPDFVYAYSEQHRPGVKAQEYLLESSKRQIKVAQSNYYPKLNFNAGYSTNYYYNYNLPEGYANSSFITQFRNNGSQSLGLSLSIPIFNRLSVRNYVRQSRLYVKMQELTLAKYKQDLYKVIQQVYHQALAAQKQYHASRLLVESSQVAYDMERKRFDAGKSTLLNLSTVQNRLDNALSQQAQARYEWIFRNRILYFYQGEPLFF